MNIKIIKNFRNLFLWQIVNKAISIAYFSVLTIMLGPYNYGVLALVLAVYEIASIGFIGVNNALQRYMPEKRQRSILTGSLKLAFSFSLVASIVLLLFGGFISSIAGENLSGFMPYLVLVLMLSSIKEVFANGLFGLKEIKRYISVEAVHNISKLVVVSAFIFLGMGVVGVLLGLAISAILAALVALFNLKRTRLSTEVFSWKKLYGYGSKFVLISLIYQVQPQVFIFFLSRMEGVLYVGYYKFLLNLVLIAVVMLPQTLSLLIFPYVSEFVYKKSKKELEILFNGSFKLAFYMGLLLSLIFYAIVGFFVRKFFEEYTPALSYVLLFLIFGIVQSLGFISATLMKATDSLYFYIKLILVTLIISLLLTPLLINFLSVGGAILSYTFIMVVITFVLVYTMTRKVGIKVHILPSPRDFGLIKQLVKGFFKF